MVPFYFERSTAGGDDVKGHDGVKEAVDALCMQCVHCECEVTTFNPQIACEKEQWVGFRDRAFARRNCALFEAR